MSMVHRRLEPGARVRVTQHTILGGRTVTGHVTGTIVSHGTESTGSWYAHAKEGRFPIGRLRIRKDDGEITAIVIDESTKVTVLTSHTTAS